MRDTNPASAGGDGERDPLLNSGAWNRCIRNGNGGNNSCWEIRRVAGGYLVRDTKVSRHFLDSDPGIPTIWFSDAEWHELHLAAARSPVLTSAQLLAEQTERIKVKLGENMLFMVPIGNEQFTCFVTGQNTAMTQSAEENAAFFAALAANPAAFDSANWIAAESATS